jgi:hypothetical protein
MDVSVHQSSSLVLTITCVLIFAVRFTRIGCVIQIQLNVAQDVCFDIPKLDSRAVYYFSFS